MDLGIILFAAGLVVSILLWAFPRNRETAKKIVYRYILGRGSASVGGTASVSADAGVTKSKDHR